MVAQDSRIVCTSPCGGSQFDLGRVSDGRRSWGLEHCSILCGSVVDGWVYERSLEVMYLHQVSNFGASQPFASSYNF